MGHILDPVEGNKRSRNKWSVELCNLVYGANDYSFANIFPPMAVHKIRWLKAPNYCSLVRAYPIFVHACIPLHRRCARYVALLSTPIWSTLMAAFVLGENITLPELLLFS